jgi:hypothetical protein
MRYVQRQDVANLSWQQIPPHLWPLSVIPRMCRANLPHDRLRHQLLSLRLTG